MEDAGGGNDKYNLALCTSYKEFIINKPGKL
jgi:hypothetical protein